LNLRPSGYEPDGQGEAFSLVDHHFHLVSGLRQVPAITRCSPLFTDGLVHRWYIAGLTERVAKGSTGSERRTLVEGSGQRGWDEGGRPWAVGFPDN
jgi:hypothetical protein